MTPEFERDLLVAQALGHGEFEMDIKWSEHMQREKFWFMCSCGYRSTVRWSAADAMQVAQWHIRKVAQEHRNQHSRNGGVSLPGNVRAAR